MITGSLADFERRVIQRGYTMDQVRACIVSEDGDSITVDESHPDYPRERPGLGDMAAAVLSSVGITKERVSRLMGSPCGCPERQAKMNAAGARWLGLPPGSTAKKP